MRYAIGCGAVLAATLILGACAQKVWVKPGATQADLNRDLYVCERDARQSGYFGGGIIGALNMQDFHGRCMVAHGWWLEGSAPAFVAAPPAYTPAAANAASPSGLIKCKFPSGTLVTTERETCLGSLRGEVQ